MLENTEYNFSTGVNRLVGDIDSGVWAASYYLSMYKHRPKDFILFGNPEIKVNDTAVSLSELAKYSCYLDEEYYPLFSSRASVRDLITKGIKRNKLNYSPNEIKDLFELDSQRFERRIACVGNERFRAMAAVGLCHGKQIFCFPWHSLKRFEYYHNNILWLLDILKELEAITVLPVGK